MCRISYQFNFFFSYEIFIERREHSNEVKPNAIGCFSRTRKIYRPVDYFKTYFVFIFRWLISLHELSDRVRSMNLKSKIFGFFPMSYRQNYFFFCLLDVYLATEQIAKFVQVNKLIFWRNFISQSTQNTHSYYRFMSILNMSVPFVPTLPTLKRNPVG